MMFRAPIVLLAMVALLVAACGDGREQVPQPPLNAGPATSTLFNPSSGTAEAPATAPFPDPTGSSPATPLVPGTSAIDGNWFICIGDVQGSGDVCNRLLSPGFGLHGGRISVLFGESEIMQPGDSYCEMAGGGSYTYNGQTLVLMTPDGNQTLAISVDGDRATAINADGETGMLRRLDASQSTGECSYTDMPQPGAG